MHIFLFYHAIRHLLTANIGAMLHAALSASPSFAQLCAAFRFSLFARLFPPSRRMRLSDSYMLMARYAAADMLPCRHPYDIFMRDMPCGVFPHAFAISA